MLPSTDWGETAEINIKGKNMIAQNNVLQNSTESTALPLRDFFFAIS